jgi:hypothetical protein
MVKASLNAHEKGVRVEGNGPEEINAMYFKNRKDGLRVGSLSHLINAQV